MTHEQKTTILVTGAAGNTGRPLVAALLDGGAEVRAMIRTEADSEKIPAGAQTVVADFDQPESIRAALSGVQRTYLVTPSSEKAERQQVDFADAAAAAGVERIVVLSQLAADLTSPVRFLRYHAVVERHIEQLGLPHVFLRPNLYFQGLLAFAGRIATRSAFAAPIGDTPVSAVDVRDVSEVAAHVLLQDNPADPVLTITGPTAVTHQQIAEALSVATGRTIEFSDSAPEDFASALTGILPPWQVEGLLEDYAHYRAGEAAFTTSVVGDLLGRPARSVADFARDHAATFSPASTTA